MDLDNEFKKLNYALKSYKCDYHADYEDNINEGTVSLLLLDSGELPIITEVASYGEKFEFEVNKFKKLAINACSHIKV